MYSDVINTVSSSYKKEVLTKKYGFGVENILKKRRDVFSSIRNGVDHEIWNPVIDPYIASNYAPSNLDNKLACKRDLIQELNLSLDTATPLIGVVSYMTANKGFDILLEAADGLMDMDVGLIVSGQGDDIYAKRLLDIQKNHPGKVAVRLEFNPCLTHKIAAGTDIFLIPSRYEPCGLNQLIGFRYGSVPVVRATGGLRETVRAISTDAMTGNGFVFKDYTSCALLCALREAVRAYKKPRVWQRIILNGLKKNYSWESAAKRYARLYQSSLNIKRGG
jgi:starch synthase